MEEQYKIDDHGTAWVFRARGKTVLELSGGAEGALCLERAKCGKFGELSALPDKFRLHRSEDGCSADVESSGVIPFGCEYRVSREFSLTPGCAVLTSDISAVNYGKVDGIELEPVAFCGEWEYVEFLIFGEERCRRIVRGTAGVVYSGDELPLLIRVAFASGRRIEFAAGADLWRHRAARRIAGASAGFEISVSASEVRLTRRVLTYAPEAEPERRPWRFTSLIGWSDGVDASPADGETLSFAVCVLDAKVRRELRNAVRRASTSLVWSGVSPRICREAAHVARNGRGDFEHFDLEELVADWRWANRLLRKDGRSLRLRPDPRSVFADSVILSILGKPLEVLE